MRKLKGFTLIELLIVIIIIGILATIAVVSYGSVSAKAKQAAFIQGMNDAITAAGVCLSNGDALVAYTSYSPGGNVCGTVATAAAVTSVKWPSTASLNGYSPTLATSISGITSLSAGTIPSGFLSVTCTASGCTK